jgi:hypothetical protein
MRVCKINFSVLLRWYKCKGFLRLTTDTLLEACSCVSRGVTRSHRVACFERSIAAQVCSPIMTRCQVAVFMYYAQNWSLLPTDEFLVLCELRPAQCVCGQRALLLGITWQWTLWETFQRGNTPACLMLVVASGAINKRVMCFKVIDSPYRCNVLSPGVEANAGKLNYWRKRQKREKIVVGQQP